MSLRQADFRPVAPERVHSTRRTACSCRYFWRSSPAVAASPPSLTAQSTRTLDVCDEGEHPWLPAPTNMRLPVAKLARINTTISTRVSAEGARVAFAMWSEGTMCVRGYSSNAATAIGGDNSGVRLVIRNFGIASRVCLQEGHAKREAGWRYSMTKFTLLSVATILSTALVGPALAQAVIQARNSYAFYHPNRDSRLGPTPPRRREDAVVSRGSANAMTL